MALGGGTFTAYDKVLPGSYINIVSGGNSNVLGARGTVAMPLSLDWGPVGSVFKVKAADFKYNCLEIFGCTQESEEMKKLRDLFRGAQTLIAYRVANNPQKATCSLAEAIYPGVAGNRIRIKVSDSVDEEGKKVVTTFMGTAKVDVQMVEKAEELKANSFVSFKKTEGELEKTEGVLLTGGTNGTQGTGLEYQAYLEAMEPYSFSVLACDTADDAVKALFRSYTERMNDETGAKFQCVLHKCAGDYEGIINVESDAEEENPAALVYWTAGAQAGCALGSSLTNAAYDGEYEVVAGFTQNQLRNAIQAGKFVFHMVDDEIRVLKDINSLVTTSNEKNEIFKDNKTVRVMNQVALDIAAIFNKKYLGLMPNDTSERISLWNDIVKHHLELEKLQAITGFSSSDVVVSAGDGKGKVVVSDTITISGTMEQLYMTVVIQ